VRAPIPTSGFDKVLRAPYRGAPQTVALIKREALRSQNDYNVRELTEAVCAGLPSKDYAGEALAIYHFVLGHTRYMRDPRTVELVRSPDRVARALKNGHTPNLDCDDMAALIAAMLLSAGHSCRIVTVAFRTMFHKGERQFSHVFTQSREPYSKVWITIDPVAADKTSDMLRRVKHAKVWPVA
jgi:hypothetical protein